MGNSHGVVHITDTKNQSVHSILQHAKNRIRGGQLVNHWLMIAMALLAMTIVMGLLWIIQKRSGTAGIVDVAWSIGTGICAVLFAVGADGNPARRLLIAVIAGIWGLRLGIHLLVRLKQEGEDGRYLMMRQRWGDRTQRNMLIFYQIQAIWAVLFALPMLIAARNPSPLTWLDAFGAFIWLAAIAGESIADRQLAAFKSIPQNKDKVCNTGLWKFTRHPNYFFEWTHWWAYVLIAFGGPYWWFTLGGPIVMYVFVTRITGIPPTEARSLKSRGDAYRHYQQTTNAFFPGPQKTPPESRS